MEIFELYFRQNLGRPPTQRTLLTPSARQAKMLGNSSKQTLVMIIEIWALILYSFHQCLPEAAVISGEPLLHAEWCWRVQKTSTVWLPYSYRNQKDFKKQKSCNLQALTDSLLVYTFSVYAMFMYEQHTPPHRHALIGHNSLQCVKADRVHVACKTQIMSALCIVQRAQVKFGRIYFQLLGSWSCSIAHCTRSAPNCLHTLVQYRAAISYSPPQYWRCGNSILSTYSIDDVPRNMSNTCTHV